MTLEEVLLESCTKEDSPNTLHLLEFVPCVLLGFGQSVKAEVNEGFCRENGIEINRRISGGGCIYTDGGTLGWEIIAKKGTPGIPQSLKDMYRVLCEGVVSALLKLGIAASYRPLNDVEINGRKISGTGGTELDDSFIFHGTLLVNFNTGRMLKALKVPNKKGEGDGPRTVCMRELLGIAPSMEDVKLCLANSFAEMLGIEFEKGPLSEAETQSMDEKLSFFASDEWIYRKEKIGARK